MPYCFLMCLPYKLNIVNKRRMVYFYIYIYILKLQLKVIKLSRIGIRVGPENLWVWVLLHDHQRLQIRGGRRRRRKDGGFDTTVGPSRFRLLLPLTTCQRGDSSAPSVDSSSELVSDSATTAAAESTEGEGPPFTITCSNKPS